MIVPRCCAQCFALIVWTASVMLLPGCPSKSGSQAPARRVVVYTSLDQIHSEPIMREFEQQTGIRVEPVYDAESAKTTGLVSRLIVRRDHPDCDVFWNNEVIQTQRLARMGLLAPYRSPQAQRFPEKFRDPQDRWTGFAARARVLIYNTRLVPPDQAPTGLADLAASRWRGQAAIAEPFFGTTFSHVAILYQQWGPDRLGEYLAALGANDVALCAGNGPVRDLVAQGERALGLTDTDDAYAAMQSGKPVKVIIPDADGGAVLIPNTVSLVAGCPHPQEGRQLIDFLLSAEVERRLAQGASAQIPLGEDLKDLPTPWTSLLPRRRLAYDVVAAAEAHEKVMALLNEKGMNR